MLRRGRAAAIAAFLLGVAVLTQLPGSPLRVGPPAEGALGALEGRVRLSGDEQFSATVVSNTTDPDVCGRTQNLEDMLVDGDRGVANAIVALVDAPALPGGTALAPRRIVIDNRACRFAPHVAVAALGDTIVAINNDPVFHTTHFYGPLSSNVALPEPGQSVASVVGQVGIIAVLCDLHGWMKAFIRVDDHRFHDVSDPQGSFRIEGIPPGDYAVEIWHEKLGTQRIAIQVEAGKTTRMDVEYAVPD